MAELATETFQHLSHLAINKLSTQDWRIIGKNANFEYIVNNIMLNNYFTLAYIAGDLSLKLRNMRVRDVFTQESDELVVGLEGERKALLISCHPQLNSIFLHSEFARARTNSLNLLKNVHGSVIREVQMDNADRIIVLTLDVGLTMYVLFFGPKSNVLLVDASGIIVDAFKSQKDLLGKPIAAAGVRQDRENMAAGRTTEEHRSETISASLRMTRPQLGSRLVQEALFRAGIPLAAQVNEVDDEHRKRLEHEVQSMMEELKTPHPVVYLRHGTEIPVAFSIIPLHHLSGVTPRQFDDIHHAIRYFVTRRHSTDMAVEQKEKLTRSLRRRREQTLRAIEAVRTDLADASRADEYERYGSILMAHLDVVTKGMNSVEIRDGADIVRIPIDVRRTAVQNAQRYFEKAKRSRSARRQSGERLKELENVEASASRLLTELDRIASKDDIKEFMSTHARKLEDFGIVSEGKEEERLLFRVFDVEGGFQVWAGKNEANNDLLTLKHAKPHDLWFHARGSGGSHVVLKVGTGKGTPGKQAREQAAGIAAYYSKMKNAKVVPVAMTEKKYVRKPKGAPPGSVIVERERVIFAEPRLPDQKRRPIG